MGVDSDVSIDHRNGDRLDNRKTNLRIATSAQNMANKKLRVDNTSGYKGVSRAGKKWIAAIGHRRKQIRLGLFKTPQQAALAYDDAARKLWGAYARYNFPQEGELGVHDGPDGFKAPTYVRTTVSIPSSAMHQIREYLEGHPGVTVSSFLTDAAIHFIGQGG